MYNVLCLELLAVLLLCVCVCVLGGGWYQTDFFFAVLNGADYSHISNGCGQLHLLHKCPIWADTFINALNYDKNILFLFWEYTLHILFTFITILSNSFCYCNTYAHCYRRYYVHSQTEDCDVLKNVYIDVLFTYVYMLYIGIVWFLVINNTKNKII